MTLPEDDPARFGALMRAALLGADTTVWEWNVLDDQLHGDDISVMLLGYTSDEAVRTQDEWNERIHPDDLAGNDAAYLRHARGDTPFYEHEYRARARDGGWRWLSERGRIVERTADGRPARVVGTVTDITQRRLAELALIEMGERLHKIARHVPGMVFQFLRTPDGRGSFPYVSERCAELTGCTPQELLADAAAMLRRVDPEDHANVTETIAHSMRHLQPWHCDFRLHLPDGRVCWLSGTASPQSEADGSVLWHGYVQDTTELRQLEQERQARAIAEAASGAKTRFLSRMSHELRTPLNAVLGFAQLMELDASEPLGPTQRRRVGLIREAGAHLLEMIGELLDLTRIEAGKLSVQLAALPLAPLLAECLDMLRPQAGAAGVELALETAPAGLDVRADPTRLRQVLLNLLSNAVKYNRRGGSVRLVAAASQTEVCIEVHDSGMGIAAADIELLFEPFHRGAHQRSTIEGAGIGLAITRGLVALMNGRMAVRSTPGRGSSFSVYLARATTDLTT